MENNIPAFAKSAFANEQGVDHPQTGMTLLDYFAAKAMQAIIEKMYEPRQPHISCIQDAYYIASHMLETRKQYIK